MGGFLLMACQTLEGYKVQGAGGRDGSPTDRRPFGPGARTARHARRPEGLRLPNGAAGLRGSSILVSPPHSPPVVRGVRRRHKNAEEKRAGTRQEVARRPAAWTVRAAQEKWQKTPDGG